MRRFAWNSEKNTQLIQERHVSFERVVYHIENNGVLNIIGHPNPTKYPNQKMFIVNMGNYVYLVPFVENEAEIFLKTIILSFPRAAWERRSSALRRVSKAP
ncbi:toxin [Candidatus Thiosymbion oneisti]|uniref:toxin n=1 Tax=Candidatus Thiosymbion oneisti TaxID=589554 RepID=UPI001060B491|nr:toxin [Candidatus Thiosymbion oneisti]